MPDRRKSPEEVAAEIAARAEEDGESMPDDGPEAADGEAGQFVPFTETDRAEANEAFGLMIDNGFITVGPYELSADGEGRKMVTLTAFLPNTIDSRPPDDAAADGDTDELPTPDDGT